ncbi:glucose-6-phosphate isomerase [Aeromicrobium sp. CF3.5]|uniref:glucose-6-phosphate isomerase n=1 Tax=Aeromicrobium sp. CF3.5 TaxID=3373078 RepID=UPI003EE7524B
MVQLRLSAPDRNELETALEQAVTDQVASRLAAQDATLWGSDAESEAAKRLSWVSLATTSRPLVEEIVALRDELNGRGLDHVVLCGMGGSSLAPEVICHTAGVELTVLDSSQPDMVRAALADRLERTIVVVSSKSGGTVETDSQRRAYEQAFRDADLDPAQHIVIVTDPGSPLHDEATVAGYRVFTADPHVGGRYSALTAFGLVPSGLAGVDIGELLDDAADAAADLATDEIENPALQLGVLLGTAHRYEVDKLVIADRTRHGIGDWIEQLVAESTGKLGTGILPVVVPDEKAPNFESSTLDSVLVVVGDLDPSGGERALRVVGDLVKATAAAVVGDTGSLDDTDVPSSASGYSAAISGALGAQMLLWEVAVAISGRVIGINPFDQPDVESAKQAARDLLGSSSTPPEPDAVDGDVQIYGSSRTTVAEAVADTFGQLDLDHGYVAIQAYLDRVDLADLAGVREDVATRLARPVTFGWGPRFLHSTGQYHKGGTPNGVFVQITCDPIEDLAVPGRDFTFGSFIASQAAGDAQVLRDHGRPVLRLHLSDLGALARVREALQGATVREALQ